MQTIHLIVAFIQPFQFDAVVNALRSLQGFPGMSVSEIRGFGRHGAHSSREGERNARRASRGERLSPRRRPWREAPFLLVFPGGEAKRTEAALRAAERR